MKELLQNLIIGTIVKTGSNLTSKVAPLIVSKMIKNGQIKLWSDLPYQTHSEAKLDVYAPIHPDATSSKPLPISIFIHGGGFRYYSKKSHAVGAAKLAKTGRVVFSIDYRLAPLHPFPHALQDTADAYEWILKNAHHYGGHLDQISIVAESAGANLALGLCLHLFGIECIPDRTASFNSQLQRPTAAVLHCGCLQVSHPERYNHDSRCYPLARSRLRQVSKHYLPQPHVNQQMADPVVILEQLAKQNKFLPKNFPKIFIPVGDRDPIYQDSVRLHQVMQKLNSPVQFQSYAKVGHGFYLLPLGKAVRQVWSDISIFLKST
jgi:acetyl esterase